MDTDIGRRISISDVGYRYRTLEISEVDYLQGFRNDIPLLPRRDIPLFRGHNIPLQCRLVRPIAYSCLTNAFTL